MCTFYRCMTTVAYSIFTIQDEIKFNSKICLLTKQPDFTRNSFGWGVVLTDYYHTLHHKSPCTFLV